MRIIFAGTPEIARGVLATLLAEQFEVALVLTQPDRPAGRGMKLMASPVKQLAESHGLTVLQPLSFKRNPEVLEQIRAVHADIMVVVAYGLILPPELLSIPAQGCINIHVSLLPRHRGAAPIQRAVLAGDTRSGVSIMQMDSGLDTGPVRLSAELSLDPHETSSSLHDRLAELGARKIVEFLRQPEAFPPLEQSMEGVTYAAKLSKEEARLDWNLRADELERRIRGYNPFPGAYSFLAGQLHKFWQAHLVELTSAAPAGSIVVQDKQQLLIVAGDGRCLAIDEIQEAGAKRKPIVQYLQGKGEMVSQRFADS